MSFFASCNGLQIVGGQLMIPLVGIWTADLQLASNTALTGNVTVIIGNLTLQGSVYRSEIYGGQTRARLVAGYGGWRTVITSQGYGSSSGVLLSTVMNDAATGAGEQINVAQDMSIGMAYTRANSTASDILWQMLSQGFIPAWYVDPTGVTQCATWPSNAIGTPFTVTEQKPDEGLVVIATEDYASWMPGCTFTSPLLVGSYTSGGVNYNWDNDGTFRFEVLTDPNGNDRYLGPIEANIQRQIAPTRFYGRYKYTISNPSTTTVDADPVNTSIGLPELQNVRICADSISLYVPPNGGECHIMFLDGVPTDPICVWTAETPTMAQLLSGTNPVARLGDQVQCFLPQTLPITGIVTIGGMPSPLTGTILVQNPITGVITEGSPTVSSD